MRTCGEPIFKLGMWLLKFFEEVTINTKIKLILYKYFLVLVMQQIILSGILELLTYSALTVTHFCVKKAKNQQCTKLSPNWTSGASCKLQMIAKCDRSGNGPVSRISEQGWNVLWRFGLRAVGNGSWKNW